MKKLTCICLLLFLAACQKEVEDTFDASASARLNTAINEYQKTLNTSTDGWLLSYYPKDKRIGGYNYLLSFENGKVSVLSETNTATPETSTFSLKDYAGPFLSFDTYNKTLMSYAKPSEDNYNPESDFEFQILNYKDDIFTLRGLKTGVEMTLRKFSGNKSAFFDEVKESYGLALGAGIEQIVAQGSPLKMTVIGRELKIEFQGEVFTQIFIPTQTGFKLYEPITVGGITFEDFSFSDDKKYLIYDAQGNKTAIASSPIDFSSRWTVELDPSANVVSQEILDLHSKTADAIWAMYPGLFLLPQLDFGTLSGNMFGFRNDVIDANTFGLYGGTYQFAFQGVMGKPDYINFLPIRSYGTEVGSYWNEFPPLQWLADAFANNSPYKVSDQGADKKIVSEKNPNFWFILKKS